VRPPPELDPLDDPVDEPPDVVLGALRGELPPADRPRSLPDDASLALELLGHGERFDRDVMFAPDDGWLRV